MLGWDVVIGRTRTRSPRWNVADCCAKVVADAMTAKLSINVRISVLLVIKQTQAVGSESPSIMRHFRLADSGTAKVVRCIRSTTRRRIDESWNSCCDC